MPGAVEALSLSKRNWTSIRHPKERGRSTGDTTKYDISSERVKITGLDQLARKP